MNYLSSDWNIKSISLVLKLIIELLFVTSYIDLTLTLFIFNFFSSSLTCLFIIYSMSELILPSNVTSVSSQPMPVKWLQGSVSFLHLHVPLCPISGGEQCQIGGTSDSLAATLSDTLVRIEHASRTRSNKCVTQIISTLNIYIFYVRIFVTT